MTEKGFLKYWIESADDDFKSADSLFKSKRYHHALFFCHLSIEKLLKGLIYKNTNNHAPPIHDLEKLSRKSKLSISDDLIEKMDEITTWNIKARYDDYKRQFYKKANEKYTTKWFIIVKELILWLKSQY